MFHFIIDLSDMKISKILFYITLFSSLFFLLVALNHYFIKSSFVLVGVVTELFTLPLMFIQFLILGYSLVLWMKTRLSLKHYPFWAVIVSFCNSIVILGTLLRWID